MKTALAVIGAIIFAVLVGAFAAFTLAWFVMLLWNWLMPTIFKLPEIDFWQAFGLNLLSALLLKSSTYKSNNKSD